MLFESLDLRFERLSLADELCDVEAVRFIGREEVYGVTAVDAAGTIVLDALLMPSAIRAVGGFDCEHAQLAALRAGVARPARPC